jgi:folate-binding Fe-S cluster repair protein YgfZ
MTQIPPPAPAHLEWSAIDVRGDEARDFLQSQLSQDVARGASEETWTLLLQPDGTVLTSSRLACRDDGYRLTVPRALASASFERLRRFHRRIRCTLELVSAVEGPFATRSAQIDARWPLEGEYALALPPQSYGARFVESTVSFVKGCFTGQELVARLDARAANVPWRLAYVEGPTFERIAAAVASRGPASHPAVTTWEAVSEGVRALAVVHRTVLEPAHLASLEDVAITPVP